MAKTQATPPAAPRPRASAPAESVGLPTMPVTILNARGMLHPDGRRLMERGDVIEVPGPEALSLIRAGHASGFTLVRARADGVSVGNRVCALGEEAWCEPDRAERLAGRGQVAIVRKAPDGGR